MRFLVALVVCAGSLFAGAGELSGRRAPGFALPDSQIRYHDLQDYRGRIVILEFMQTNCPHCATLGEILEKVKAKYPGKVSVLAIVNPPSNQTTVGQYIAGHKLTYPILFDCGQMAGSYLAVNGNTSVTVPHIFIIDAQGTIAYDYGYDVLNRDIFEGNGLFTLIDRMLAGGGGAGAAAKKK